MTTDPRKLAQAIENRLHLIPEPSIRADMAQLCKYLVAALDERDALRENRPDGLTADEMARAEERLVARLQAENEALRTELRRIRSLTFLDCLTAPGIAERALKENHGKQ